MSTARNASIASRPDAADALRSLLERYIAVHEAMVSLTGEHRSALSRADGVGVARCTGQLASLAQEVRALDAQRTSLAAQMLPADRSRHAERRATLTELAALAPEPMRAGLLASAARLKELLLELQRRAGAVRLASRALVSHMDGLMQQVARSLNRARVYSPAGRIEGGAGAACGLDVTR